MAKDRRGIDGSNTPDNPLNAYRMSMLAHGFTEEPERRWRPTLNPWLRPEGLRRPNLVAAVAIAVVVAVVIAAALLL